MKRKEKGKKEKGDMWRKEKGERRYGEKGKRYGKKNEKIL